MFTSLKNKIIAAFITLAGLFGYQITREPEFEESKPPVEVALESTPSKSGTPELELGEIKGNIEREDEMIRDAIALANHAMSTDCFKDKIIDAKFTENNGFQNSQIYDLLASKKVRIKVTMFYGTFAQNHIYKTMGYDIGDGTVYANRYFVQDPVALASLMIHEAQGHGQGFRHDKTKNTSVPYQLNKFFDDCYTQ